MTSEYEVIWYDALVELFKCVHSGWELDYKWHQFIDLCNFSKWNILCTRAQPLRSRVSFIYIFMVLFIIYLTLFFEVCIMFLGRWLKKNPRFADEYNCHLLQICISPHISLHIWQIDYRICMFVQLISSMCLYDRMCVGLFYMLWFCHILLIGWCNFVSYVTD